MGPPSWNHGYREKRAKILESCWSLLPKNAKNPTMKLLGNWGIGEWRWEKEKWSGGFSHSLKYCELPSQARTRDLLKRFLYPGATFWLVGGILSEPSAAWVLVFFPNLPATIYFSESWNNVLIHYFMFYRCIQWDSQDRICLLHLTWN